MSDGVGNYSTRDLPVMCSYTSLLVWGEEQRQVAVLDHDYRHYKILFMLALQTDAMADQHRRLTSTRSYTAPFVVVG